MSVRIACDVCGATFGDGLRRGDQSVECLRLLGLGSHLCLSFSDICPDCHRVLHNAITAAVKARAAVVK